MKRLAALTALALLTGLSPVAARACPPPPDLSQQSARLLEALRTAPDEAAARRLSDEMWRIWTTAPDARAQEMLDRGMERREAYDFAAALAAFDELVAYCPDYAEGYNQRAFVNFLRGEYALAVEDLEKALELRPEHFAARAGLALSLMELGRIEAGQAALREALALNPWLPERAMLISRPGEDI